jgi:aspartyl-tRNA(Asn)/glutamyl-tRNA(Gln) amidotransferase subunit A
MRKPSIDQLRAELDAAEVQIPDFDFDELLPLWRENFDRRSVMRGVAIAHGEWAQENQAAKSAKQTGTTELASTVQGFPPLPQKGEVVYSTITNLARLIRSRQISSKELTELYLNRIARLDRKTQAFVSVLAESALAAAVACDKRLATGEYLGPLHGIPIALKDMISIGGVRLTGGSKLLANNVALADATVTSHLRQSGAVIIGSNTLLEFGLGPALTDADGGTGLNPWDVSRSTGGSSSGSAVAVAAGLCAAAVGTDTAGSVRLPAAICGTVGFKPTNGLVDLAGVIPMCWSLDTVGPLARSVDDASHVIAGMLGPMTAAQFGIRSHAGPPRSLSGVRVGLLRSDFLDREEVDSSVKSAVDEATRWFRSMGCSVVDVTFPGIDNNAVIYAMHLAETYSAHRDTLRRQPNGYHQKSRLQMYIGALVTADDWFRTLHLKSKMKADFDVLMKSVDVLLMPGQGSTAGPFDASGPPALMKARSRFTRVWNIVGAPAVVVPAGYGPEGLPLSLQFVGRPWKDQQLLDIAAAYEVCASPARRLPPGFD